jgi:hypothetical protein
LHLPYIARATRIVDSYVLGRTHAHGHRYKNYDNLAYMEQEGAGLAVLIFAVGFIL